MNRDAFKNNRGNLREAPGPRYAKVGLVVASALLATACAGSGDSDPGLPQGDSGTTITEVTTRSGFRCAVMDGPRGKGLSCGFDEAHVVPTGVDPQGDSGTTITEVITGSGVLCVVMDGPSNKDLECNWGGQRIEAPGVDPHGDSGTTITLSYLSNGEECAVMDGPNGKALDCDWA